MFYDIPEYTKAWRDVDAAEFEQWLANPFAPDYIVRGRYFARDYFELHGDKHFASLKRDGKVIIDPAYLVTTSTNETRRG